MRYFVALLLPLLVAGCVAGQQIRFGGLQAVDRAEALGITVTVKVNDNRAFVQSGNKGPGYIGHYRGGFGNPFDVTTHQNKALSEIFRDDLERELTSLGFSVGGSKEEKSLQVIINDWNFDAYANGKIWYEIEVSVLSKGNQRLATDTIRETKVIEGSALVGAKYAFEEEVPKIYADVVARLVRKNEKILNALRL